MDDSEKSPLLTKLSTQQLTVPKTPIHFFVILLQKHPLIIFTHFKTFS